MADRQSPVSPDIFAMYLESQHWIPVATWRGTTVWEQRDSGATQLLLPIEPENESGQKLLTQAVEQLAAVEERTVDRLLVDLRQPQADTQRFRLLPTTPSGTIPIPHARKAIEAIYGVLRDAGRSAYEGPSLYHRDQPEEPVKEFLDRVQLCLTEPGSYVFATRICEPAPFPMRIRAAKFNGLESDASRPSGHQIAVGLQEAVVKAHGVAKILVDNGRIDNPTEQGISSNLCEALADLSGEERNREFEISFAWGFGNERNVPTEPLQFTDQMAIELHRFGSQLKRLARIGHAVVEGRVLGLHIEDSTQRHRIQVKGVARRNNGGEDMKLWAYVSEQDYDRAFTAHRESRSIRIEGEIKDERGGLRMHVVSGRFHVMDSL